MADEYAFQVYTTPQEVLRKAREQIARNHEQQQKALEGHAVPEAVIHGCDTTLSHLGLASLPSELVDVIKDEVSRLALDHNRLPSLGGLSVRLHECTRLRYLVLRNNKLREFPTAVLSLQSLEYLDLKVNRIETLPEDLDRMKSIRVMALQTNKITRIPLCVGRMQSLVHFGARKNPIVFPPKDQWTLPDMEATAADGDKAMADAIIGQETVNLKAVLQKYTSGARTDTEDDLSEGNVETPRPTRRKTSGRFPIKPSVSGPDLRMDLRPETSLSAPNLLPQAPPIPSKSSSRSPAPPMNNVVRNAINIFQRPSLNPLGTSFGERNRSHSESVMSTSLRNKRMGIITRKTVEEVAAEKKADNRLSHLRGMSDGVTLQNGLAPPIVKDSSSPTSPVDVVKERSANYVRRLSSLPEGKRKSQMDDPYLNIARGILYALDQIHLPIKRLIGSAKDSTKIELQKASQEAFKTAEKLEEVLQKAGAQDEEMDDEEQSKASTAVRSSLEDCMQAFEQLTVALQGDLRKLILEGNQQIVRTVMHLLYGSLVEIRNSCAKLGVEIRPVPRPAKKHPNRGRYLSPAPPGGQLTSLRFRDNSHGANSRISLAPTQRGHNIPPMSRSGSSNSLTSNTTTLHPPATITNRTSRSNTLNSVSELEEDEEFQLIARKLKHACEYLLQGLPSCSTTLQTIRQSEKERNANSPMLEEIDTLITYCQNAFEAAKGVWSTLATLHTQEPGIKNQFDFWQLAMSFIRAYLLFTQRFKEKFQGSLANHELKQLTRPMLKCVKEVAKDIDKSPWAPLAATDSTHPANSVAGLPNGSAAMVNVSHMPPALAQQYNHATRSGLYTPSSNAGTPTHGKPPLSLITRAPLPPPNPLDPLSAASTHSTTGNTIITSYQTPMPATPMAAALGPAAVATVPMPISVPQTLTMGGLPTPGFGPTLAPATGLLTPTMALSPGPGPGAPPAMSLNATMSSLASPGMVASVNTPTTIPTSMTSPVSIVGGLQSPPPQSMMVMATNGLPGAGPYYPNQIIAMPMERTPTQQSQGYAGPLERSRSMRGARIG